MNRSQVITLLIPSGVECFRGVIRGVNNYFREPQATPYLPVAEIVRPPDAGWREKLKEWDPVALITHLAPDQLEMIRPLGKPFVQVLMHSPAVKCPSVDIDNVAVGRMAAEHFLDRGFKQFVFTGEANAQHSMLRWKGFRETLVGEGFKPATPAFTASGSGATDWIIDNHLLHQHLTKLARPLAVFAATDAQAVEVARVCVRRNIAIPYEVALLGVDNDESLCQTWRTPLSSVKLPFDRIGYEAAAMLDRILKGEPAPKKPLLLGPTSVVVRPSSDILAIDDPIVAAAIRYIRENIGGAVSVKELVSELKISRQTLERSFRQVLHRTPHQEIRRVQLETAKRLLAETNLPMSAVAIEAGFSDATYLSVVFHQQTGKTPTAFRRDGGDAK